MHPPGQPPLVRSGFNTSVEPVQVLSAQRAFRSLQSGGRRAQPGCGVLSEEIKRREDLDPDAVVMPVVPALPAGVIPELCRHDVVRGDLDHVDGCHLPVPGARGGLPPGRGARQIGGVLLADIPVRGVVPPAVRGRNFSTPQAALRVLLPQGLRRGVGVLLLLG
ncbi:hypothetical protein [Streptomyces sp. JJ38]|uniref:hypothetical protein n=1 Tax=Streptomyces sp. JJ38 TaxID=2738128 RepID=UPI001C5704E5|nr:hypothetical protein [Streptomyces sp. JJ38]MBW1597251.1 hypothetical protein [Streptomyces sp. JJ38]